MTREEITLQILCSFIASDMHRIDNVEDLSAWMEDRLNISMDFADKFAERFPKEGA